MSVPKREVWLTVEPWVAHALCARTKDPDVFFPAPQEHADIAKQICGCCSVRAQCLGYALERPSLKGVWAGKSERERIRLRNGKV